MMLHVTSLGWKGAYLSRFAFRRAQTAEADVTSLEGAAMLLYLLKVNNLLVLRVIYHRLLPRNPSLPARIVAGARQ